MLNISLPTWPQARFQFYGSPWNYLIAARDFFSGHIFSGEADIERLEKTIADRLGVPYALATPQGRVALYLAIKSLTRPSQEVVMSPYTIYDVVNMVLAAGCRPVFADVQRHSGNIDPSEVERLVNDNTGAVLVTHLHGLATDMDKIMDLCRSRGIHLIEDTAQAFGGSYKGQPLGGIGTAGVLSFGRVKNVNGFFGGMVVTHDKVAYEKMRQELTSFPPEKPGKLLKRIVHCLAADIIMSAPIFPLLSFWIFRYGCLRDVQSINKLVQTEDAACRRDTLPEHYRSRMTPMQARIISAQLHDVDTASQARIANAKAYSDGLQGFNNIILPPNRDDGSHIYLSYPVQVSDRWSLVKHLMKMGNDLVIQHIRNTADLPCFQEYYRDCPVARQVAQQMVLLPCYPGYSLSHIHRMIKGVQDWARPLH